MTVAPLETLSAPLDGALLTVASFGKPVYDLAKALIGDAAGTPDCNNGNPIICRMPQNGMLAYTNALGLVTNPGAISLNSATAAGTVPAGQMWVITQIWCDATGPTVGSNFQVNIGAGAVTVAKMGAPDTAVYLPFPLVIPAGSTWTAPLHTGWTGYAVVSDSQITPVVQASGYSVPSNKTFILLGAINTSATTASVSCGTATLASATGGAGVTNTDLPAYGSGVTATCPPVISGGSASHTLSVSTCTIFGVTF